MRRCENCGGTEFITRANRHIQCDVIFNTFNGEEKYQNLDDLESPDWFGFCTCTKCGKTYRMWQDIPDDGAIIEHWESPALRELRKSEK